MIYLFWKKNKDVKEVSIKYSFKSNFKIILILLNGWNENSNHFFCLILIYNINIGTN